MKTLSLNTLPIIIALVVAIAPHVPGLPPWMVFWCLGFWGYFFMAMKKHWPLPGRWICLVLACGGSAGVALTHWGQWGSGEAFVGLMAVMAAIKPFEMNTHRHRMIAILLSYFIVVASLFRWASLWVFFHLFVSVFITTVALIRINYPGGQFSESVFLTGRIMLRAVPLAILLFITFPRLPDSFLALGQGPFGGRSGFAEQLKPGAFSRISQNQSMAFRAIFDAPLGKRVPLYWRGIVFDTFDGLTWTSRDPIYFAREGRDQAFVPGRGLEYTIRLEPHKSQWLPALESPVKSPPGIGLTRSRVLWTKRPVTSRNTYRVVSQPHGGKPWLLPSSFSRERSRVRINLASNLKAVALANELAGDAPSVDEKVRRLLAHFSGGGFVYSTTVETRLADPIDVFLTRTRTGYCEHYASAFAFMMNALGVSSRVVGGYLGGELNPLGNYITVRNAFAHAWAEIYHPEKGWLRVDPTLAVSPDRLTHNPDGSWSGDLLGRNLSFFKRFQWMMELANIEWEAWFAGYSLGKQKSLLRRLGFDTGSKSVVWGSLMLIGWCGAATLVFFLFRRQLSRFKARDPIAEGYALFCKRLAQQGIVREENQGPMDFARMAGGLRPDLKYHIDEITHIYVWIRYRRDQPDKMKRNFGRLIRDFKPGTR